MRMNRGGGLCAADVLNGYSEERLADVFYLYGELREARRLASAVCRARESKPFAVVGDLLAVADVFFSREREKKDMARVFQALRIEVNDEMGALRDLLSQSTAVLRPGGRLVVITYHSLEDRMVKNLMKTGRVDGRVVQDFFGRVSSPFRLVNNRVIVPSELEQAENPRSRSAKLRIAEKL